MTSIIKAGVSDVDQIAPLFDAYRQFYDQKPDIVRATNYIRDRLTNEESTIFFAENVNKTAVGFTQLYPTYCSVAANNVWVLYDLYVAPEARQLGIGTLLMNAAKELGAETSATWLKLETGVTNLPGQALYEKLGWERDEDFYTYFLELNG